MTRTDVHRIAVLDPADYELAAFEDVHEDEGYFEWFRPAFDTDGYIAYGRGGNFNAPTEDEIAAIRDRLVGHGHNCVVCGGNHGQRYWHYFLHLPSGEIIQVGSACSRKVGLGSREELEDLIACERRVMAEERGRFLSGNPAARRALDYAMAHIERTGLVLRDDGYCHTLTDADGEYHADFVTEFYRDLTKRFNREANITDKQVALAIKLETERPDREQRDADRAAQRQAEEDAAAPIPDDVKGNRVVLTGKVATVQFRDNDFGGAFKLLLIEDRGFKVWGTCPEALLDAAVEEIQTRHDAGEFEPGQTPSGADALKGRRVQFTARVEPSDDDPQFGFFSRPTKPAILEEVA